MFYRFSNSLQVKTHPYIDGRQQNSAEVRHGRKDGKIKKNFFFLHLFTSDSCFSENLKSVNIQKNTCFVLYIKALAYNIKFELSNFKLSLDFLWYRAKSKI